MTPSQLPTVRADEVGDSFLLDVREPDEWQAGRAPSAVHVPMGQVPARLDELPRDRPVAVVCHLGGRSAQVTAFLVAHGFDARNVEGGMRAWAATGLPLEAEPGLEPVVD